MKLKLHNFMKKVLLITPFYRVENRGRRKWSGFAWGHTVNYLGRQVDFGACPFLVSTKRSGLEPSSLQSFSVSMRKTKRKCLQARGLWFIWVGCSCCFHFCLQIWMTESSSNICFWSIMLYLAENIEWHRMWECVCSQSCVIPCDPLDCSLPGSSVHDILQTRLLEQAAVSYSRGSSWPKDQTHISCISCLGRWILYHGTPWASALYVRPVLKSSSSLWAKRSKPIL